MATMGISEFYKDKSVLITGSTGFMGKVLVEKLLRSCSEVKCLYLLMRGKKGQPAKVRLQELTNNKMFEKLKKEGHEILQKLVVIEGDIMEPNLGLSDADFQLLIEEVNIVFHCAATVKFDEVLKLSVAMNLTGTKRLLHLCHQMHRLESVVHVSTAYCNCHMDVVHEQVYPAPADPEKVMRLSESLDDDLLGLITPELLKSRPNTYTFTKALAEHLVLEQSGILPIAIVRPSIVTGALKEPLPGWVDNLNGPTGLLVGAGKGVLRSILCHKNVKADFIPVDVAINFIITAAWYTATFRPNSVIVYNCTSGATKPLYWRDVESHGKEFIVKHPFSGVVWYPGGSFKGTKLSHNICDFIYHLAPAYFIDTIARLAGRKPVMVRVQEKIKKAMESVQYFTTKSFQFTNDNMTGLLKYMSPEDRETFNFDLKNIDWRSYFENYVLGTREFILKDDPSTLPQARLHLRRMYWLQKLWHLILLGLTFWVFTSKSGAIKNNVTHLFSMTVSILNSMLRIITN